jgi:hypothetical protein
MADSTVNETAMQELLDKQAIYEVVLRYCRAVDRMDMDLLLSCYHEDGIDHHTGFSGVAADYVAWVSSVLGRYGGSMHFIGSPLGNLRERPPLGRAL